MRDNSTLYYLHTDRLGSTRVVTDSTGQAVSLNAYYPFGASKYASGARPTDMDFTGQRLDGTGLNFYNARYYDSAIGRFISADTVVPGAGNSQGFNRYAYSYNNPLKLMDPTGHTPCGPGNEDDGPQCYTNPPPQTETTSTTPPALTAPQTPPIELDLSRDVFSAVPFTAETWTEIGRFFDWSSEIWDLPLEAMSIMSFADCGPCWLAYQLSVAPAVMAGNYIGLAGAAAGTISSIKSGATNLQVAWDGVHFSGSLIVAPDVRVALVLTYASFAIPTTEASLMLQTATVLNDYGAIVPHLPGEP